MAAFSSKINWISQDLYNLTIKLFQKGFQRKQDGFTPAGIRDDTGNQFMRSGQVGKRRVEGHR
jgi:hypothetical protein